MISLIKSQEFFDPNKVDCRVHIIGCGSVGSTIAENLVRCGIRNITLYDFDKVEPHNVHNQMFDNRHIWENKAVALKSILVDINDDCESSVKVVDKGWQGKMLSGYVFLAVDNIDLRRQFVEQHMDSPMVKGVFDVRTMLTGAQTYFAEWDNPKRKDALLRSMQFSHEEAKDETPTSACGVTLGIVTTVRIVCAVCVNNFINYIKGEKTFKFCQFDGFEFGEYSFEFYE